MLMTWRSDGRHLPSSSVESTEFGKCGEYNTCSCEQKSNIAVNAIPKNKGRFLLFNKTQFGILSFGGWPPPHVSYITRIFQKNHEIEPIKNAQEEIWFLTLIGLWHHDTIRCNMLLVPAWMKKNRNPQPISFVALRFGFDIPGLRYDLPSKPACLPACLPTCQCQ